jgi:hypothetical protein
MGALTGGWPLLFAERTRSRGEGHLATTTRSDFMHGGTGLVGGRSNA